MGRAVPVARKRVVLAILGVLGVAGVAGASMWARRGRRPLRVVDVSPRNTAVVAEVSLAALRRSSQWRALSENEDVRRELQLLRDRCGADPVSTIDAVALTMPAGTGFGAEAAIVAVGRGIRAGEVSHCAEDVVRRRGGAPRVARRGGFVEVTDGDGARGVLLVRDGGPILVGRGMWLDALADVADGAQPSIAAGAGANNVHGAAGVRDENAVATVTYAIPDDERGRLAAQLPKQARALADVSSIVGVFRLRDGGSSSAGALVLDLDAFCNPGACAAVGEWVSGAIEVLRRDPRVAVLGLREVVLSATSKVEGDRVRVSVGSPMEKLSHAWDIVVHPEAHAADPRELPAGHPSATAVGPIATASTTSASREREGKAEGARDEGSRRRERGDGGRD